MFKYTEKKLANDIGRVAKSIDPSLRYTYLQDTREVELRSSDDETGGPYTIFLGNIFLKVSELSKDERLATVEAFLREVLAPKELSPDELMNSLALRIRTDFEIDFRNRRIALMGQEAPPSIVFRRGELLVEIVSDRDESVSIARSDDLAEIGVTQEEAIRMASAKIRRCTDEFQWKRLDESIWISRYQDDYDFARLVAALESAKFPFDGQPIVFAPSHSICLTTDNTTAEVLSKMAELGNEAAASHRPFCQLLWTFDQSGEWRQWKPRQTSEARAVAQLQVARETVKRYEETKDYLEHSLGEDVFVATYQAIQNDDGLTCYSVYTLDLPSYLPVTDFVVIIDPERPGDEAVVGRVDWHEFEDCLGSVERVENMNPVWYRVIQPLDASRKDRIRKLARPLH
jgi:hypothetical protein